MSTPHFIVAGYWIAYCLLHSLLAAPAVKRFFQRYLGRYFNYYRLFYSLFATITLALLLIYQFGIHSVLLWQPSLPLFIISTATGITGLLLMTYCIKKYFGYMSGIHALQNKQEDNKLYTGGVNRYMRHPLYTGTLLLAWSLFLLKPLVSHLLACSVITVYTFIGAYIEEQKLLKEWGIPYEEYRKKTAMFIPFLL